MTAGPYYGFVCYDSLPHHMRQAARDYVEKGFEPGGFLTAVLENDLTGAALRADDVNARALMAWASWLYNEAPSPCWGSKAKVKAWVDAYAQKSESAPA